MSAFIVGRLLWTTAVLVSVSFAVYALIALMPGDPIDLMVQADPNLSSEDAARLKALFGVDRPLIERWSLWALGALQGDFGFSRLYALPAIEVLVPRLVNTLWLMTTSLVLAIAIAVPLGVAAAMNRNGPLDRTASLAAFAGISMPPFWLALLLIVLFSVKLGWLPAGGTGDIDADAGLLERLRYLVLPVAALTLLTIGSLFRFVRSSVIESSRERFVITALAKGLSYRQTIVRHVLGHAMLPIITLVALQFGTIFSGALVIETVFAYLGMGKLIYDAILGNDYNLALAALMLATLVTLAANLAADLAYAAIDPRIRLDD